MRFRKSAATTLAFVAFTMAILLGALPRAYATNFGNTSIESGSSTITDRDSYYVHGNMFTLPSAYTVTQLCHYPKASSGNVLLGVYADSGRPSGPLLVTIASTPIGTANAWQCINVVTPTSLAAGNYWLQVMYSSLTAQIAVSGGHPLATGYYMTVGASSFAMPNPAN